MWSKLPSADKFALGRESTSGHKMTPTLILSCTRIARLRSDILAKRKRRLFGSIRKLPSGRCQASFIAPNGDRVNAPYTFDAEIDADFWLSAQRVKLSDGTWTSPEDAKAKEITFGELAKRHISVQVTKGGNLLRANTKEFYSKLLRGPLLPFENIEMHSLTSSMISDWNALQLAAGKKTSTARAYSLLSAVCARALREGLITSNPCTIRGARSATSEKKVEPPTRLELSSILGHLKPNLALQVTILASAGLRFSELAALKGGDIIRVDAEDEQRIQIRVDKATVKIPGGFETGATKSKNSVRTISLNLDVSRILDSYIKKNDIQESDLLFTSGDGGPIRGDSAAHAFSKAVSAAGLSGRGITLHGLRHFAVTQYALAGASLSEVKDYLGDKTTQAAIRYLHSGDRHTDLMDRVVVDWIPDEVVHGCTFSPLANTVRIED